MKVPATQKVPAQKVPGTFSRSAAQFFVLLAIAGCGPALGTGTGNPNQPQDHAGMPSTKSAAYEIRQRLCAKIDQCHPSSYTYACDDSLDRQTSFGSKMGTYVQPAPSLFEIAVMESKSELIPLWPEVKNCITQFEIMSCTDQRAQDAFVDGATEPYAAAAEMLSDDCRNIFGP